MDMFLIVTAIVLFIFGVLLVLVPGSVKKISDFLDKKALSVEDKMRSHHRISGIILVILGIVIFYLAFK